MLTSGALTIGVWTGAETFTETCGTWTCGACGGDGAEVPDDDGGGDDGGGFGTVTLTDGAWGDFGTFTVTVGACGACWGRFGPGVDEGGRPPPPPPG
jgi:hypothetical protein